MPGSIRRAYTGLPPIYLARGDKRMIAVPEGSVLNLRVHGAPCARPVAGRGTNPPRFHGDDGEYSGNARLARMPMCGCAPAAMSSATGTSTPFPMPLPVIAFTGKPTATEHQATQFSFRASDDYGVTGVRVVIRPHGRGGKPLTVDLPLAQARPKR